MTGGAGGTSPPAADVWKPGPGLSWQWQLTGTIDTSVDAAMFDIDLFDAPASTVSTLHARGRKVVCYTSAGSFEGCAPGCGPVP